VDTHDSIKQEKLLAVMEEDGIDLIEQSNHWKCVCPFHDDTNPSMVIFKDTHYYKCYACGVRGDVYDYLWHQKKMGYNRAVEYLNINHRKEKVIKRKPTLIEQIVLEEKEGVDVISKYGEKLINHLLIQELERLANGKD
jgi:DNA primase